MDAGLGICEIFFTNESVFCSLSLFRRQMMKVLSTLLLLLFLDSAQAGDTVCDDQTQEKKLSAFFQDEPDFLKNKSFKVLCTIAPLKHDLVKIEANEFVDGDRNELHTLVFDGLEVYGNVLHQDDFLPFSVTVTSDRWLIPQGLNIGVATEKITEVLGKPDEISGSELAYHGEHESVIFLVKDGHVSKITFAFYSD